MDRLGLLSTIIVYIGFLLVPNLPIIGIVMLLVSNALWILRSVPRRDWSVVVWQSGFVIINLRWLMIELK